MPCRSFGALSTRTFAASRQSKLFCLASDRFQSTPFQKDHHAQATAGGARAWWCCHMPHRNRATEQKQLTRRIVATTCAKESSLPLFLFLSLSPSLAHLHIGFAFLFRTATQSFCRHKFNVTGASLVLPWSRPIDSGLFHVLYFLPFSSDLILAPAFVSLLGLCNRQSCPLANSQYATIREENGTSMEHASLHCCSWRPSLLWWIVFLIAILLDIQVSATST